MTERQTVINYRPQDLCTTMFSFFFFYLMPVLKKAATSINNAGQRVETAQQKNSSLQSDSNHVIFFLEFVRFALL